jgi:putative FmdB family regulatory protein
MPNYEYRCLNCKRRFEVYLSYSEYGKQSIQCPHCSSEQVRRRIGRIRFARSEESHLDDLADPANLEGLEDDPRALGRMMRKMKSELGSEAGDEMGPEFDEVVNRLEAGQSPEEIEKAIPDLAEGAAGMDAGGFGGMDDDF